MKKDIHPQYNKEAKVICACGHEFVTGSVLKEIKTDLCSVCHPFYTGKQKLVDTARRVEKFKGRMAKKETLVERKGKKAKRTVLKEKVAQKKAKKGN